MPDHSIYDITYERSTPLLPGTITDQILWVVPPDWDISTARQHFEATQHCVRVIDIAPSSYEP
jgi:hypothetical protein